MYYYIKGKLTHKGDGFVVVDAGGVGYQLFMATPSIEQLGSEGSDVTIWSYLYVKEGIMDLYGFASQEEKTMFLNLIGVSGIGSKSALSVLSVASPQSLAMAIITKDYKLLQKAQGIGMKAAQRIVLELSDKLKGVDITLDTESPGTYAVIDNDNRSEALSALIVLGYSDVEARQALKTIDPTLGTEEIIKQALKKML